MAKTIETLVVEIDADIKGAQAGIKKTGLSIGKLTKSLIGANLAVQVLEKSVKAAAKFLGDSSKAASRAEEVWSKFGAVFKGQTADVKEWAVAYSESLGLATTETAALASSLQDTFVPLGFVREEATELSKALVELAGDVGSFNDSSRADVIRDFQSAIVGNTETIRKYGVVASQAAIEQEAINSGLIRNKRELTASSKAQAIYQLLVKGTADAQGDLERTQESTANVTRRLASAYTTLQEEVGKSINRGLTPLKAALAGILTEYNKVLAIENDYIAAQAALADATLSTSDEIAAQEAVVKRSLSILERFGDVQGQAAAGRLIAQEELRDARKRLAVLKEQLDYEERMGGFRAAEEGGQQRILDNAEELRLRQEAALAERTRLETREKTKAAAFHELELERTAAKEAARLASLARIAEAEAELDMQRQEAADEEEARRLEQINSINNAAESMGRILGQLIQGELTLAEAVKRVAVDLVSTVLRALGEQYAVEAAAAFAAALFPPNPAGFAKASGLALASGAAFAASGLVSSFADGTPPGGYVVPPGYTGDNFPVMAKSGETVNITPSGEGQGIQTQIIFQLDTDVLADTTMELIANRRILITAEDIAS